MFLMHSYIRETYIRIQSVVHLGNVNSRYLFTKLPMLSPVRKALMNDTWRSLDIQHIDLSQRSYTEYLNVFALFGDHDCIIQHRTSCSLLLHYGVTQI